MISSGIFPGLASRCFWPSGMYVLWFSLSIDTDCANGPTAPNGATADNGCR